MTVFSSSCELVWLLLLGGVVFWLFCWGIVLCLVWAFEEVEDKWLNLPFLFAAESSILVGI